MDGLYIDALNTRFSYKKGGGVRTAPAADSPSMYMYDIDNDYKCVLHVKNLKKFKVHVGFENLSFVA